MKQSKWENGEWYNLNYAECSKDELLDLQDHIKTEREEIEYQIEIKKANGGSEWPINATQRVWHAKANIAFKKRGIALDRLSRYISKMNNINQPNANSYESLFVENAKYFLETYEFFIIHNSTIKEMEKFKDGRTNEH